MLVIHILSIVYTFDTCEKVSEVYRSVGCCTGNGNIFGRFITPGINVSEKPSIIASEGGWTGKDAKCCIFVFLILSINFSTKSTDTTAAESTCSKTVWAYYVQRS